MVLDCGIVCWLSCRFAAQSYEFFLIWQRFWQKSWLAVGLEQAQGEGGGLCWLFGLSVVPDADVVAGRGKGCPGDVEPGGGSEELVGVGARAEVVHEAVELR